MTKGGGTQLEFKGYGNKSYWLWSGTVIKCTAPKQISWDFYWMQGEAISHAFRAFVSTDGCVGSSILRKLKRILLKIWHGDAEFQ